MFSILQVSGVGYNGCGHVTIAGQTLTPNSNLSITKAMEVRSAQFLVSIASLVGIGEILIESFFASLWTEPNGPNCNIIGLNWATQGTNQSSGLDQF